MLSNVRRAAKFIRQIRSIGENREILIVDRDTDEITEKMSNELGVGNKYIKNGHESKNEPESYQELKSKKVIFSKIYGYNR